MREGCYPVPNSRPRTLDVSPTSLSPRCSPAAFLASAWNLRIWLRIVGDGSRAHEITEGARGDGGPETSPDPHQPLWLRGVARSKKSGAKILGFDFTSLIDDCGIPGSYSPDGFGFSCGMANQPVRLRGGRLLPSSSRPPLR
jgi:hypothetical protein